MILYVLRHGIAEDTAPGGDSERTLTAAGTLQVATVAKGLHNLGITFDRIIASPFVRARETAEIIGRIAEYDETILQDGRLTPSARPEQIGDLVAEHDDAESLLITGHLPALADFIGWLCGAPSLSIELKPASLTAAAIDRFRPHPHGTLLWSAPAAMFSTT
jgi:phosphohistidine phosphatase